MNGPPPDKDPFPWRLAASLGLFGAFIHLMMIGKYFAAVWTAAALGYVAAAPLVSALLGVPALFRWWRFRDWQGIYVAFEGQQIRMLPGRTGADYPLVAIEDVDRAVGRSLGRFSTEWQPADGLLKGLRCVRADALLPVLHILAQAGQPAKRTQALRFTAWLQRTLLTPVDNYREQSARHGSLPRQEGP